MESISFIGGDSRNFFVSEMFGDECSVFTFGLGLDTGNFYETLNSSKYIVLPIPFTTDKVHLYTPLSAKIIDINEFINTVSGKIIIGGALKPEYTERLKKNNNTVIDIMKDKELVLKNTIPTAEGVIKIVIENTDITVDGSNIAVLGFGNVGKKIAEMLKSLKSNVFCYDIKPQELANISFYGYNVLNKINEDLTNMDVIINTVPDLIIDKEVLSSISKETLIVDVASAPGGVDYSYSKENGYKVIQALGLPGKVAPRTSAKYIKEVIDKIIK